MGVIFIFFQNGAGIRPFPRKNSERRRSTIPFLHTNCKHEGTHYNVTPDLRQYPCVRVNHLNNLVMIPNPGYFIRYSIKAFSSS